MLEVDLMDRFQWTPQVLDEVDQTRVLPNVRAHNVEAALRRIQTWLETQGKVKPPQSDWDLYVWAKEQAAH